MKQGMGLLAALAVGLLFSQLGVPGAEEKAKFLNPYTDNPEAIKEGRVLYFTYSCNACHGGGGGGGMAGAPPLIDDVWNYGSNDETLYKLIRGEIPQQMMPSVIGKAMTDEEIWKVLVFVRSLYQGDPSQIDWVPPAKGQEVAVQAVEAERGDPLANGKAIYATVCSGCHGPGGKGDGPVAATLNPKPKDFTDKASMAELTDQYLFKVISQGGASVGKSPLMPPAALDEQDIQNVINYIKSLVGP